MSEHEQDQPVPDDHDTVAKKATVTVKDPVDGTPRKRARKSNGKKRKRAVHTHAITVDERVMEAAKAVCKPSQKVRIVSATEVMVVNK